MSNVLDLADLTLFLGERATGATSLLQCVWVYDHAIDIGASKEFLLARGDDDALDALVAFDAGDRIVERVGEVRVQHVHRAAREVQRQRDDAVSALVVFDCGHVCFLVLCLSVCV